MPFKQSFYCFASLLCFTLLLNPSSFSQMPTGNCLVPCEEIISGGPPKDGIPALVDPEKLTADEAVWLNEQDVVLGIVRNGEACAYPLRILYWHEIVNDTGGGERSVITYCPLTGTGIHYDGQIDSGQTDFGVSGQLWSSNLIMYNRSGPESWWSQIYGQAIVGSALEEKLTRLPVVETRWGTWKRLQPNTKVLSNQTGYPNSYSQYPYGNYEQEDVPPNSLFIRSKYLDDRLPPKRRVLGLNGDDTTRAYPFPQLQNEPVVNDTFEDEPVLVVHHPESRMALAFDRRVDNRNLTFSIAESELFPFGLRDDQTGSLWTILGEAVSGSLAGEKLKRRADGIVAFWFAWGAFYQGAEIYTAGSGIVQDPEEISDPEIINVSGVENWEKLSEETN